eukprot:3768117-Ditylum_brightwellii.AAC.1
MDSVLQLVGLKNSKQNEEKQENEEEDESQQDKSGLIRDEKILVTALPKIPEEEEVQGTNQNQSGQSGSSHSKNFNEHSGWKANSTFLEQSSTKNTVMQHTAGNTSNTDKIEDKLDEEYVQYGSEDGMSLGNVSNCSGEVVKVFDMLADYMLKDGKKNGELLTNNVLEEENKILDCDDDIDGDKIDDIHCMTEVANNLQLKFKEDEDAVKDDLWVNG